MTTKTRAISGAMFCLAFGVSAVANAQGKHGDKPEKAPHEAKAAPAPKAAKPAQAPHVAKEAKAEHAAKPAHVQRVQRVQKTAPAPRVRRAVASVQKPTKVAHVAKRVLVVARVEQQKRLKQQQHQAAQYRKLLEQQNRLAQRREAEMAKQNRKAYSRFLQQYYARLAQQQRQMLVARDYSRDPYITSPYAYQYAVSGYPRYTNEYGANVLKQAVNYGYQQGYQGGQADRQDGWAANYRNSYAYTDANYGYAGNYVSQSDYNYYFRQGFQRGYEDGYNSRSQYGNSLNGSTSILGTVLSAILNLTNLR